MTNRTRSPGNMNESFGPREVQAANATRALGRAGSLADTLVPIATDEDRLRWGARSALEALIGLGAAWRGAWADPEDGEFHAFARGADGFYTHDHQAPDDGTEQGEDR